VRQAGDDLLEGREVVQQQRREEAGERGPDPEQRGQQRGVQDPEQRPLGAGRQAQPERSGSRGSTSAQNPRGQRTRSGRSGRESRIQTLWAQSRTRGRHAQRVRGANQTRSQSRRSTSVPGPAGAGGHSARTVQAGAGSLSRIVSIVQQADSARRRT
jgi:hypothetical protein